MTITNNQKNKELAPNCIVSELCFLWQGKFCPASPPSQPGLRRMSLPIGYSTLGRAEKLKQDWGSHTGNRGRAGQRGPNDHCHLHPVHMNGAVVSQLSTYSVAHCYPFAKSQGLLCPQPSLEGDMEKRKTHRWSGFLTDHPDSFPQVGYQVNRITE